MLSMLVSQTATAANQTTGGWMWFASEDKQQNGGSPGLHVKVSGNSNIFQGPIKSNGDADVSGNNNAFNDKVRYYDVGKFEGTGNTYAAGEPQQEAFDSNWPGTLNDLGSGGNPLPTCTFNFTSDKDMSPDDPDGVYCGDGDTNFTIPSDSDWPDCGDFDPPPYPQPCEGFTSKKWTFITGGKITMSGENIHVEPFADNILGYTTNNNPDAIKWSGNEGFAKGIFFAPNGGITVQGNESLFCLSLVAELIDDQGNEHKWQWPCFEPPVEDDVIDPAGSIIGPCADPAYAGVFDNSNSTVAIKFRFRWRNAMGWYRVGRVVPAGQIWKTWEHWAKPNTMVSVLYRHPDTGQWIVLANELTVKGRYPNCDYIRGWQPA